VNAPAELPYYRAQTALFSRCNLTPLAIASQRFQEDPRRIEISWVREENVHVFDGLGRIPDAEERGLVFHEFVLSRHWLHEEPEQRPTGRARLRNSYSQVIQGWGMDSNGASGAVLKGWAENRFGLRAIYHKGTLAGDDDAMERYASERMRGMTTGIGGQLDLLYTYCQDELERRHPGERWLTLYRGTHDAEAYTVKTDDGHGRILVEFNTLSSFTADAEVAWEFGSRVWEVRVPLAKIVFFSGLLPLSLLQGEREYIVLGGDYLVRPKMC
jgi:NAD+---dinitrogen-reductase ADP-D-ribosyltransferase